MLLRPGLPRRLLSLYFMPSTRVRDGLAGAASAGLALGVSELAAGIFSGLPSLVEGVGNWVIDVVPKPIKDWAISVFGTNDKLALLIGMTVVVILLGALVGVVARRQIRGRHRRFHRLRGAGRTRCEP